ncbi:hypothetical protein FACS1894111_10670 [Clostridia bacterium]|nr:hypothetical protein FACS1894111_10670 [Clostridia bacterium]
MDTPTVSVIMLTCNREKLVGYAIESVLAQTFRDFEFIIVDNGSVDDSGVIAERYAATDVRIRVIHQERGSIGFARNIGLGAARGKYITFVDDDDTCEPDFLEFLLNLAGKYHANIAICGVAVWEDEKSTLFGVPDEPILMDGEAAVITLLWRKRYSNGFPAKLFERSLFYGLIFPEKGSYEDICLMYKLLAKAKQVVSFGLAKYNALRHGNNNSAATTQHGMITAIYLSDYRAAYGERTAWLCERFPRNAAYWQYFDWSFQISMVEKIIKYNLPDCETHLAEMRQELFSHSEEFLGSSYILDFEKEWMNCYVLTNST